MKEFEFITPKNPTDPIVVFDPEFDFSNIVVSLNDYTEHMPSTPVNDTNFLNIDAITQPLLKLNNKIIFPEKIYSLEIYLKEFLPKIKITVEDSDKNIQASDVPGMNNIITVILTAPVDGASKKMVMDFYITDCIFNEDNTVTYIGEYKANGLKQVKYTQIGDSPLSTYEYLYKIAKELKLGFACTNKCKEINDKKWRQIYSDTYVEYINKELKHAGIDEDSIFDAWIDNFGYIVLVNISYVFSEKLDIKQLSTKVIHGVTNTLVESPTPKQEVLEVYRIINNIEENNNINNLYFSEYHSVVDNKNILKKGTKNKYFYLSSPCDQNILQIENIRTIENSVDGIEGQDEYVYENIEFIGTNQSDEEGCELFQEQVVENYLNKIYAKSLVVTLENANYSLQRGMIVFVYINEYEQANKQLVTNNAENAITAQEDTNDETANYLKENILDEIGVMNPSLSGLYYIKDITFSFTGGIYKINQTLTLIKRDLQSNIVNKYTSHKHVK